MATDTEYTSRLIKGGALLHDVRLLVRSWRDESTRSQTEFGVRNNVLAKATRARATDVLKYTFVPRYVDGPIPHAWRIARALEDRDVALEIVRPVYYWITARSEVLVYEFAADFLNARAERGERALPVSDTVGWLRGRLGTQGKSWSEAVVTRVAQGLHSTLRDFGIIEGRTRKRIAPAHLPVEAFAYLAYSLHRQGALGDRLVRHRDWRIFLLTSTAVEHLFLEAHQRHLLEYHAAGKITRIEFPVDSFEAMADAVAARTH